MLHRPFRATRASLARAFVLASTLAATCLCAISPSAFAGTYTVDGCQRPDGTVVGTDGWTATSRGSYVYHSDTCASGGSLSADFDANVEHDVSDFSAWNFSAPSGTSIDAFSVVRQSQAGPDRPYGSPMAVVKTGTSYIEQCGVFYGCSAANGVIGAQLGGAALLVFDAECGGGVGSRCPAGLTRISVSRAKVTLADSTAPRFLTSPTGSLTSSTSLSRIRSLLYSAADDGGGVYRQRVLVDGAVAQVGTVDTNGGKCVRYPVGDGFAYAVPCKQSASGSVSFDTASLADGAHEVVLEVTDATDSNKVAAGPWSITVDNVAPAVGAVSVTGTAREGEALACAASVDGQAARTSYQWARAAADGSGQADIVNASTSTYTLTAADVGKKVLCTVTGTDGGGSASRSSPITSGPFANGGVVAVKPADPSAGGGSTPASGSNATTTSASTAGSSSTTTNSSTTTYQSSTSSGSTAAAFAAAAAAPVCRSAAVRMADAPTPMTRSYRRSATVLAGRLTTTTGEPRGGEMLDLVQTVVRAGTAQRTTIATVRTGADGSFRLAAPRGPSRALQIVHGACGAVGPIVTERVRGALQARTATRHVRNKHAARISGRALGGYVGRGIPLELQVQVGRQWRDVKHVMTSSHGTYRVAYRFQRTFVHFTYRFRVVTRAGGAWPFTAARSRVVKVTVN